MKTNYKYIYIINELKMMKNRIGINENVLKVFRMWKPQLFESLGDVAAMETSAAQDQRQAPGEFEAAE